MAHRAGRHRLARWLVVAALAGCSRSGLEDFGTGDDFGETPATGGMTGTRYEDGAVSAPPGATDGAAPATDAGVPPIPTGTATSPPTGTSNPPPKTDPPDPPTRPGCTPHDETCNGKDDDCDGRVDEDQPAIPCAGGGEQYCIAGRYSACPERCQTCLPGSERVCFLSYCTFWAVETCSADGRSFGTCRERHVPPACSDVSKKYEDSPELEQCCIDKGYCCHDEYDLDHDGDRGEMLGQCDEVSCHP